MKRKMLCLLCFALPLFCLAQVPFGLKREYDYDAAGNRILRKVIMSGPEETSPPAPPDSTQAYPLAQTDTSYSSPLTPPSSPVVPEYYVETLAQTEIKIYPNPTAEKIAMEISGWEKLEKGSFTLFSLNGQLLQEHPVHAITTEISLTNLPKGAYLLKVHINGHTEEWKVIKN